MATNNDELMKMGLQPLFNREQSPEMPSFQPARNAGLSKILMGIGSAKLDPNAGFANNLSSLVQGGAGGYSQHRQNVNSFNAYNPYFQKMGLNTDALNPANGGSGFGDITPLKMLETQSTLNNRENTLKYKTDLLDVREKIANIGSNDKNMLFKEVLDTLKITNPNEYNSYTKNYDFSMNPDGTQKNAGLLNTRLPNAVGQQIINGTIPLNKARIGNINQKTNESKTLLPGKVKIQERNANKPYFKPNNGNKANVKSEVNTILGDYEEALQDYNNGQLTAQQLNNIRTNIIKKHKGKINPRSLRRIDSGGNY